MASSLPSTFLPSHRFRYDVFLNFKGEDTRNNFTDHLYTALVNAGYHTFRDGDVGLERGKNISSELERAIRESKLSIIVFSKGYASSRWCLDELANILELKKSAGHMVLPIFYHVDPSDVRKQTGTFADAFARHETRFHEELNRVERWRAALREVADLAGLSLQDGSEAKFIQEIVEKIERKLNLTVLAVGGHLIGANYRVEDINSWLQDGSSEIGIGAICGMGGIGKTTIAKIAYNMNFNKFEGSSFLTNIREASKQHDGLVRLQRQLISDIQKRKKIKISNVDEGIIKIKNALRCKRVLMFLDDVDDVDQLDAILEGMRDWFYPGSKIIITTRDESLLKKYDHCTIFKVTKLTEDESLQLLSWHAFQQGHPVEGYMAHARIIVQHCGGLPLALKVLGSSLYGESVDVWESAIRKLKVIPDKDILNVHEILKISYNSLKDDLHKNLFLDIAIFFVGRDRNYTITILDLRDFNTKVGIQKLVYRCLITIDNEDKLQMHQLLQDMGREIIRQESPKDPGERSRLWDHEDAFKVLRSKTGTKAIEGLILNFPTLEENVQLTGAEAISCKKNAKRRSFRDFLGKWIPFHDKGSSAKRRRLDCSWHPANTSSEKMGDHLSTEAFARMHKLWLLSLNYVQLTGGYENFPKDLRWLCWHGFPLESIPNNFSMENLVALEMRHSSLTHLWKMAKFLGKLKILDLSYSHSLIKSPDFSGLPSLERLVLKHCISLVEVHESIGDLKCLVFLSLKGCKNLRKLPLGNLTSLKVVSLSGCTKLFELVKSESSQLWRKMWDWIPRRQHLEVSFPRSLVKLSLANSNLTAVPSDICNLATLWDLDLGGNPIHSLPENMRDLTMLQALNIFNCQLLQSILELPTSLIRLNAAGCTSLERAANVPDSRLRILNVGSCDKLVEIEGVIKLEPIVNIDPEIANILGLSDIIESLRSINVMMRNGMTRTTRTMPLQVIYEECGVITTIFLPGSEIPNWFSYCKNISLGNTINPGLMDTISFKVPLFPKRKIRGLNVCLVYTHTNYVDRCNLNSWASISVNNVTKGCRWAYDPTCWAIPEVKEDMILLSHWKLGDDGLQVGDEVTVSHSIKNVHLEFKKIGIHLVHEEEEEEEQEDQKHTFRTCCQNVNCYPLNYYYGYDGVFRSGQLVDFKEDEVYEIQLGDKSTKECRNEIESAPRSRTVREPTRVVVQTTADFYINDDGWIWRNTGSSNYPTQSQSYECASPSCRVTKEVKQAHDDLRKLITTYVGEHNHDVPVARGCRLSNRIRMP